jgi:hypothetical protein
MMVEDLGNNVQLPTGFSNYCELPTCSNIAVASLQLATQTLASLQLATYFL